jgi:hypothetical protein
VREADEGLIVYTHENVQNAGCRENEMNSWASVERLKNNK